MEFFGVDLLDLWRGRLSIRRVGVLINSLMKKPGRSTLLEAMDERTRWGESEYLLARISDALEVSNYLFFKANAQDSDDLDEPLPIPRPGQPEPEEQPVEQFSSAQELSNFLGQISSL
ncbi:hypothetical protein [Streptomyces sp. NPDC059874]|uniref:hypothetical protein n=1 Tax=Streptomyces sp. NPDC059874 TaxID=3346983 RepID=UPI00365941A7